MINDVRQVELAVFANGSLLPDVISAEIRSNSYLSADRFDLVVAYALNGANFWSALPLQITVQVGLNGVWQSLITGNADSVDVDPVQQTATLHGRDLTALLIAAQNAETFENRTASQIAETLANRHGLTPAVTATTDIVGRYFQTGRTRSALSQHATMTSDWDIMTWLAEREGLDVWVHGSTLYFAPLPDSQPTSWISPELCTRMRLHRALDLAAGATVIVKSWDSAGTRAAVGTASSTGIGSGGSTFTALRPNLSIADATLSAQRTLAQLSIHANEIECEMPGELTLLPRCIVGITGTGTDFDASYQIVEVERRICFERGFTQTVVARSLPWTAS